MKILIIGDSCEDVFVYGRAERLSPESPAPIFIPENKKICGGMSKNVFNIIKKFKVKTDLITNNSKIIKTRFIDTKTNHLFLRVDEHDFCERIQNIKKINFCNYDAVIISDYNKGFLTKEDIYLISCFHENTFLDTKKKLGEWIEKIKYIKINRKEYYCNKKIVDKHKNIIVTLDKDGCMMGSKKYPTKKTDVPDRTGAGDCFMANFVYKYTSCKNLHKSIVYANSQASEYVMRKK